MEYLLSERVKLLSQGKIREIYQHPKEEDSLLMVTSDRMSAFDFVMPRKVPQKGEVLTALTHFWLTDILREFPSHFKRSSLNHWLNAVHDLKADLPELPLERSLVIRKTEIPPFEMIFRHHLGGSVYKKYLDTRLVAGLAVQKGYKKWEKLPHPHFTPSTKASKGHDENKNVSEYIDAMGEQGIRAIQMFRSAYEKAYAYAESRGILILDTKFEGLTMIADEVITPDSSRFTTVESYNNAMQNGGDPIFLDKEFFRQWGKTVETPFGMGLGSLKNPEDPEQLAFVNSLEIPDRVIKETSTRYINIGEILTGCNLADYQARFMCV
ncbi:hypothetical protein A2Z63_00610 [Candidatus Giovannonibacteria bacterium RIFCSPLOWO2_02_44_8]|nr:MAG: hypothetical protein A2Z63_00610 [Candidatus Giovannonibacteria bacterium RIFCSPLOWO2_02_44_8]